MPPEIPFHAEPVYKEGVLNTPVSELLIAPFLGEKHVVYRGEPQTWWDKPLFGEPGIRPDTVKTYEIRAKDPQQAMQLSEGVVTRIVTRRS